MGLAQPSRLRRLRFPGSLRAIAAVLAVAGAPALTGCSSHSLVDSLPASVGGLPEAARERPAAPPAYPAVHDMPPSRAEEPLTEAENKRLREELAASRDRAAQKGGVPADKSKASASGTARNP